MQRTVGIIMNGVTGRMGTNQHLARSIIAIREQGGVRLANGDTVMPDPILMGRNEEKLAALAKRFNVKRYTTDLDKVLADPANEIYFDAQLTQLRVPAVRKAIAAKKSIYCEKPTAETTADALALYHEAKAAGIKHGVVQDKLWLPGLRKLKYLVDTGFFGRIVSARMEFGYWVFDGFHQTAQRPSWNYRKEDGGGVFVDMLPHWRYVVDNILGPVKAISAVGAVTVPRRIDENGNEYASTAEDTAIATFELESGVFVHFTTSWQIRLRRDEIMGLQVDGTEGSAWVGLRDVFVQSEAATPKPVWNPDIPNPINFYESWTKMPDRDPYDNAFKIQWELFLKHHVDGSPFPWDLLEAAKGVQLAELGLESWKKRAWLDVPALS
ncbi:MAG: gfo/Idh/MocA family oxidoreductase [Spirochaetaceae bacterium]|nr:MAG: gfo/Idh/MocA family oxidoreductase [Spirochaetaceae bacterium]